MVSQLQATFYCHLIQIFIQVARAKSLTNEGSHYETDHQFDNSADDLRELMGGKGGGGRPDMAQGGGPDASKAEAAVAAVITCMGG